jgi:CheY-like chemotaxis protein
MPTGGRLMLEAHPVSAHSPHIATALELAPADYVMIAVSDNGQGMSEAVMARAFEPFFTTKEAGKGSGLGLSLVYGFVKQSGGQVHAYSEPGIGTTIKMYLPTVSEAHPAPAPSSARQRTGGTEMILVVEDDEAVREVAAGFLRQLGYSVLQCADAEHALKTLAREPAIKLLFTDIVLKRDRNGIELARAAQEQRPDLRVLFTSGYAPNALPLNREFSQGTELLGKPYTIEQLDQMLRRALNAPDPASV